jgi:YidC/Oxa1 family membrane protein insertase
MLDFLAPLWNLIVYNPMLNALLFLYSILGNYGFAIVAFTLAVALITAPLRIKSQTAMRQQQIKTAELKPKLDEIKKKYKDNPQQLQAAQMKLYQEHGLANPLNSGCLLQLLPFPIFIGLYNVITAVMGQQPEQLMQLSQHLYPFFPQAATLVPVRPDFFGLNLASSPLSQNIIVTAVVVGLVVGSQYIQQKMMTLPTAQLDPSQAQMNQSMQLMMPLFFGYIVLNAPTGLSFYWITFAIVGIVQQYLTNGWGSLFGSPATATTAKTKKVVAAVAESSASDNGRESGVVKSVTASSNGNQNSAARSGKSNKGKKNRAKKS